MCVKNNLIIIIFIFFENWFDIYYREYYMTFSEQSELGATLYCWSS